jgi:hypothetical protein
MEAYSKAQIRLEYASGPDGKSDCSAVARPVQLSREGRVLKEMVE